MTLDSSGREECSSTLLAYDVELQLWSQPGGDATKRPQPRAEPALTYDEAQQCLILYGGWNLANIAELFDPYLSDVHTLNVATIVGPPHHLTAVVRWG